MTKEMTEGSPLRLIFNFSLPLILGSLLQQTYSLIDAAIVGKYLGINDLAAVGASTSVVFLIIGFCTGCCCGFGIPVAQAFGARSYSDLRRYVANSLWVSLIISVVLAVVTSLLCERILFMMQTPHDILHHAYLYLLVTFIGIPFTFLYNLLSSLIRALGDSKTPFYFLLMAAILNIVLDLFCILILHWGVAGAAIATVFSQAVSALLCLYYMFRKFDILKMEKGETALDKHYIKGLLDIGVPMGLQFSITAHAPKRKQRLGYVVRGRLHRRHAHQNVLHVPVGKHGHRHGHILRTELRGGKNGTYQHGAARQLFHGLPLLHLLFHRVASFRPSHHLPVCGFP